MLHRLKLPSLEERRRQLRLIFMFKVVEGLVPAMPSDQFFTPKNNNRRQTRGQRPNESQKAVIIDMM